MTAWFADTKHLRIFALANVIFWFSQHFLLTAWYVARPDDFGSGGLGLFYLAQISVAALWLSSLAWWQSTRVEESQEDTQDRGDRALHTKLDAIISVLEGVDDDRMGIEELPARDIKAIQRDVHDT